MNELPFHNLQKWELLNEVCDDGNYVDPAIFGLDPNKHSMMASQETVRRQLEKTQEERNLDNAFRRGVHRIASKIHKISALAEGLSVDCGMPNTVTLMNGNNPPLNHQSLHHRQT